MRITYLFVLCLLASSTNAQHDLVQSRRSCALTYVYRINFDEAAKISKKKPKQLTQRYLHTKTDSFPTDSIPPALVPGNYLFVKAIDNRLEYKLTTIGDLRIDVGIAITFFNCIILNNCRCQSLLHALRLHFNVV
ncbi:MAG: hypothetical protein EOO04_07475 [Chitinophagaceae bacterium]|nr:MAG: hypothetical protein EOO04_07475 [Chitinophagaceae bacterium]